MDEELKSNILKILKGIERCPLKVGKIKRLLKIKDRKKIEEILNYCEVKSLIYYKDGRYLPFNEKYKVINVESYMNNGKEIPCYKEESGKIIPLLEDSLNGALVGDTVLIKKSSKKVERILKRGMEHLICEVTIDENDVKHLKPIRVIGKDSLNIRIGSHDMHKLVPGTLIAVSLSTDKYDEYYEGDFVSVIGDKNDPNTALAMIAANRGFFIGRTKETEKELRDIPHFVSKEELKDRVDLRNKNIFTIDGAHTKDMDDAISLEINQDGNYVLGVHIADVTHYVKKNGAIWKEAKERGTSLYMVDTVIPMIPHQLSNGICSLNQHVDRLTLSCEITINKNGDVLDSKIFKSVINSKKKMTYEDVDRVLNGENLEEYKPFYKDLMVMNGLAKILHKKRKTLPLISNDIDYKIEDGVILDVDLKEQTQAMNIIEEFMILANIEVSEFMYNIDMPSPYRVHEAPSDYKMGLLKEKLYNFDERLMKFFGVNESANDILYRVLENYKNKEEYPYISNVILRSLKKARYSALNLGHFALQEKSYTHFTSPIRRLPDMILHYQVKNVLDGLFDNLISGEEMEALCDKASFMERQAMNAERDADTYTIIRYMNEHRNVIYDGYITDIFDNKIKIMTKMGIVGYVNIINNPNISIKDNVLYYNEQVAFKIGHQLKLSIDDISLIDNEVRFNIEKNLSLRETSKDYSLILKRMA